MNEWNLDSLYTSFDSSQFQEDLLSLKEYTNEGLDYIKRELIDHTNAEIKLEYLLRHSEKISIVADKLFCYCNVKISENSANEEAMNNTAKVHLLYSTVHRFNILYNKWIQGVERLEDIINKNKYLKDFKYLFKLKLLNASHSLSEEEEDIISNMKQTSSSNLYNQYLKLTNNLMLDIDDKEVPLSQQYNLFKDNSKEVREKTYRAILKAIPPITDSLAYTLYGIKKEASYLSKKRGFNSPFEQEVIGNRLKVNTVETMIDVVKDYLPHFQKFLKRKAKLLGHKDKIPYYDVFAPIGENTKIYTVEEAMEIIYNGYGVFSDEMEAFARMAFESNWIDFPIRKGKYGIPITFSLNSIKEARVSINFDGTIQNIIILAHEMGHAYHTSIVSKESIFNSYYTAPIAETASIFCQTLVTNYLIDKADKKEKTALVVRSINDSIMFAMDIFSWYFFNNKVFNQVEKGSLNPEMLNEMMENAQKEVYGDVLDERYLMPYAWVYWPHFHFTSNSYYDWQYTFGLLFAKGMYSKFVKQGKPFTKKLNLLLQKAGQNDIEDLAKLVDTDLTKKEFWQHSFDIIVEEIDLFMRLTEDI